MAQTMQSISDPLVETARKQYTTSSSNSQISEAEETEDIKKLMYSVCDSINTLYITLEKIHYALTMTNIKLHIKPKEQEEGE